MPENKNTMPFDFVLETENGHMLIENSSMEEVQKELTEARTALIKAAKRETVRSHNECIEFMTAQFGEPLDPQSFYEELFPNNETRAEARVNNHYQQPNAVYLFRTEKGNLSRRIMYKDTWEDDYVDNIERNSLALCGGLAYRGRQNKLEYAQQMNALIIDLDGVRLQELKNLLELSTWDPATRAYAVPKPTFIALSGSGVHLYYQFDKPIDLYPNIKVQLKTLKYKLTYRIWTYGQTSTVKDIQYQSINQSFRMAGSLNEKYGTTIEVFRTGERVSLDFLNTYVKPEFRVDITRPFQPTKVSLEQAKESYPDWYDRVIVKKDRSLRNRWRIEEKVHGKDPYALYHWWLSKAPEIKGGHRYFFMMNLTIYACKCNVPKEKLKKDIMGAFNILSKTENLHPDGSPDELNERDVSSALEAYDRAYYCWTLSDVEVTSGLTVPRNRRNGRKQEDHMKVMRAIQSVTNPNWREGNGRHNSSDIVKTWRAEHPEGKKADCIKDTGLSKHTVYKWWEES